MTPSSSSAPVPDGAAHPVPTDATHRQRSPRERALVLGGGGSSGNAWLIGVVAGLAGAGLDVTAADLVVGTSAGATAAAQLTGAGTQELLAAVLDAPAPRRPDRTSAPVPRGGAAPARPAAGHLDTLARLIAASTDPVDLRRRLGASSLDSDPNDRSAAPATGPDSRQTRWRATVAARLPRQQWPERALLITAVDAVTGAGLAFDRHSGVELVDAVAASTSNGVGSPPYRIGGHVYLDGGYRRNENADLAAGYARILVLSPLGGRSLTPPTWGMQLAAQVDELRGDGSSVEVVVPDADAVAAMGSGMAMMDPATRPPAARAGAAQGRRLAAQLGGWWH